MQALQRSSRLAAGVWAKSLVKPQTIAPTLTRGLSEEARKKRDAYREKMQYPDETPVYLRGGTMDKVLFAVTCLLVGGNTLFAIYRVYQRSTQ